jgi:hypothetical protein
LPDLHLLFLGQFRNFHQAALGLIPIAGVIVALLGLDFIH